MVPETSSFSTRIELFILWAAAMSGVTEWRLHWGLGLSFVVFFSFIAKYFIFIFIFMFILFILFLFIYFLFFILFYFIFVVVVGVYQVFVLFIYLLFIIIYYAFFFLFTALACIIIHIYHAYMLNRTSLKRVFYIYTCGINFKISGGVTAPQWL
jgi:hypothetical protein